ncbi:unnamed protein product [Zymoseptoria tritici ST99CH_1A5]|uniref:Uncharacterized protein n=1 Tax=Zymoseptoria tritici ST99CH_1A5 TaxID=1276529 RepID=A0A1Y6LS78_ZYMTR|nr:unnamed protein product [Zymoseptoria tritici ST99CH_1A5]
MDDITVEGRRRVLIRAHVEQIPGDPYARPWNIWTIFCELQLNRSARTDLSVSPHNIDFVHVLPGFDSLNDTKAWFLTDVGVDQEQDDTLDVSLLPHDFYLAHYDSEKSEWTFVKRPELTNEYRQYFRRWHWGR